MSESLSIPYIAPVVSREYFGYTADQAAREQFRIMFDAMIHYTRSVTEEYEKRKWAEVPVHMFFRIPTHDHGFGDFVVLHLDNAGIVASMQYTQYRPQGLTVSTWVPEQINVEPDYGTWAHVAQHMEDHTQLRRWSRAIRELDLARYVGADNHKLFGFLSRVPQR